MTAPLHRSQANDARTLELHRPRRANALSTALVDALHNELDAAIADKVTVLAIRGNDSHFCAGFDLSDLKEETDATLLQRFCRLGLLLERLANAPFVTVAIVEGSAVGAGADLAVACDHRIGTAQASFRFPGAAFGAVLGVHRLASVVGQSMASRTVGSGARIDAAAAAGCGLLAVKHDIDALATEVQRISAETARVPVATLPNLLAATRPIDRGEGLAQLVRSLVTQPGIKQRISAFAETSRGGEQRRTREVGCVSIGESRQPETVNEIMDGSKLVPRSYDANSRLQMAESRIETHGQQGTATENLFLVHHYQQPETSSLTGIRVCAQDGTDHAMSDDLIRSLPSHTVTALLECAGNGRGMLARRTPGNQFGLGLFGQAEWTGASLADLLDTAGVGTGWNTLVVSALDEGVTQPEGTHDRFAKGLPQEKALHPDTILAWQVNGAPIPPEHGGPLRLVVPGWYGIWWVKWAQHITLTKQTGFDGFWQSQRYTYQDDDGTVRAPVAEQLVRAVLTSPADADRIYDDTALQILAWAGEKGVATVDISIDDGTSWFQASRVEDSSQWGWSQWTAPLPDGLPRGLRRIAVRATDTGGRTQNWQPTANRLGYGNNGIHIIQVDLMARTPSDA